MTKSQSFFRYTVLAAAALLIAFAASSSSADILDDWGTVTAPAPPELKAVTLDHSTTALLILDMMKTNCGARPRCVAAVPNVKRIHDAAQKAGVMMWYSLVGNKDQASPANVIDPGFAPRDNEWEYQNGPDKFLGSHLEEKLKAHNIQTVVICGTSFQGVGIGTGSELAQRGYKVIVPIDCLASEDAYREQYAAWHLAKGGPAAVTSAVTLTRTTMIKF
jgi:nicotinamidase-related amidase